MIARAFVLILIAISAAVVALIFSPFVRTTFSPSTSLQDAYTQKGPGYYHWRVEFVTGDLVQGGVDLYEEPDDWQGVYDEQWRRVDRLISRRDDIWLVPYRPSCWQYRDCPPMMAHSYDPGALTALDETIEALLGR